MMNKNDWKKCVILGDSKDVIKRIPDNTIDFILTDPPYNIGKHSTGNIPLPGRTAMNNDVADWDWEDFNPEEWAEDFIRILKPDGNLFIFTSYNQIGRWYDCLDKRFDTSNFMIWHKTNPAPKIYKAGFLNSCEMVFTCWNKRHKWNFISQAEMHNFIESPICTRPERLSNPKHPAQKPVAILKKMIDIASNEGDIVFDPFMGVGSVGVAALQQRRRFIGVEKDKEYFMAAKERIESQLAVNEEAVSEPIGVYGIADDRYLFRNLFFQERRRPVLQPIVKWAGGKEKELKFITPNLPASFNNYYEPFVGGGSVFAAIDAKKYFINDFSQELISLYRNIASRNSKFYKYVDGICRSWKDATAYFKENTALVETYKLYRNGQIDEPRLKTLIKDFVSQQGEQLKRFIRLFNLHAEVLSSELYKNLSRKMLRMKVLENQRHELPEADLYDNLETAVKSSLYMYYRFLYNDKQVETTDKEMHCALFLFIRNYCYSSMFRYNSNGEFNVPYGGMDYNAKLMDKKVDYYKSEDLLQRFKDTNISNLDFEDFLRRSNPQPDDFIFLDPPYDSEFSTYAQNPFTSKDQERLAQYMINECKAKWMLIIKNTDFIYNLYAGKGLNIRSFDKTYTVSFMNRNNKNTEHLLITNY